MGRHVPTWQNNKDSFIRTINMVSFVELEAWHSIRRIACQWKCPVTFEEWDRYGVSELVQLQSTARNRSHHRSIMHDLNSNSSSLRSIRKMKKMSDGQWNVRGTHYSEPRQWNGYWTSRSRTFTLAMGYRKNWANENLNIKSVCVVAHKGSPTTRKPMSSVAALKYICSQSDSTCSRMNIWMLASNKHWLRRNQTTQLQVEIEESPLSCQQE